MNSGNLVSHGGILPPESTSAVPGIDIFGFSSGSPLPPPSPAPPTTNNTQYSLLGGTTPSTVILYTKYVILWYLQEAFNGQTVHIFNVPMIYQLL